MRLRGAAVEFLALQSQTQKVPFTKVCPQVEGGYLSQVRMEGLFPVDPQAKTVDKTQLFLSSVSCHYAQTDASAWNSTTGAFIGKIDIPSFQISGADLANYTYSDKDTCGAQQTALLVAYPLDCSKEVDWSFFPDKSPCPRDGQPHFIDAVKYGADFAQPPDPKILAKARAGGPNVFDKCVLTKTV